MTVKGSRSEKSASFWLLGASVWLIMLYPFLGTLWHHRYPLISAEALLVIAGMGLASLVMALIMRHLSGFVQGLLFSTLLLFSFALKFNLLALGMLGIFAGGLLLTLLFRESMARFLPPVLLVLVMASYLDSRMQPAMSLQPVEASTAEPARGPLIHVLTDGFMAPAALVDAREQAGELGFQVHDFFARYDFELQTRSYSHYNRTLDSMTRMFNFTNDSRNLFKRNRALRAPMDYPENKWFGIISDMGYPLSVYQTEAMDFCTTHSNTSIRCNQFPNPDLTSIREGVPGFLQRSKVLLLTMVSQSSLLTSIIYSHEIMSSWGVSVLDRRIIDAVLKDISQRPDGAYFVHLLVPHAPFVLASDCSLDYTSEQAVRWPSQLGLFGNSEHSLAARYRRIVPQYHCAMLELEKLFEGLKALDLFDDATLIVHGDHGTGAYMWAPYTQNLERLSKRDLQESYSALYAVKYPGGTFRREENTTSINVLLADTAMRLTGKGASELEVGIVVEDEPFVYLIDEEPFTRLDVDIYSNAQDGSGK